MRLEYLYAGRAVKLANRLLPSQHKIWDLVDRIDLEWDFLVWAWLMEPKEAIPFEAYLIHHLAPRFNVRREVEVSECEFRLPDLHDLMWNADPDCKRQGGTGFSIPNSSGVYLIYHGPGDADYDHQQLVFDCTGIGNAIEIEEYDTSRRNKILAGDAAREIAPEEEE